MADFVLPMLTVPEPRAARPAARRRWLDLALLISALVHGLLLAIVIFARHMAILLPPPPEPPGFQLVFEGGAHSPRAVPAPGRYLSIPQGEKVPSAPSAASRQAEPSPPQATEAPQINLLPPELQMLAPPEPRPEEQATQQPTKAEKRAHARARTSPKASPFAHPQEYSFNSRPSPSVRRGLRGSKSLDLSLGMLVRGGMLQEAVPHVTSPGADGDYLELLNEYVETHKYYPEQAAANNEAGVSVIRATILRDGTVKDVQLVESSGSPWLDMGWIGLFRGKKLAPFPDDMREAQRDFTMSMDYEILYSR